MIRLDRIAVYIFMALYVLLIPSTHVPLVKYADEISYLLLAVIGILDCIINRRWRSYRLFWVIMLVMAFYGVYSMLFLRYNTPIAILSDAIVEMKPYMSFAVLLALAPRFSKSDKQVLRIISVASVVICFLSAFGGHELIGLIHSHPAFLGLTVFFSSMVFLFVNINEDGTIEKRKLYGVVLMILCGLVCTRSKYYGECVLALFFLFVWTPGLLKGFNLKHYVSIAVVLALVLAVSWQKIDYYFISGTGDATRFDPSAVESYARPVLYFTGGLILLDHIPLGTGLASFATNASISPYSGVYHEYGIDKVYGLSEAMSGFICDAYYPSLAQFGFVGLILFISFFIYICRLLKRLLNRNTNRYRYYYVVGSLLVCYVLIECIAGTSFSQAPGVMAMMLLGIICSREFEQERKNSTHETENIQSRKKYL